MKKLLLLILFIPACTMKTESSRQSGTIRVRIPWQTSPGTYSLSVVELLQIRNLFEMSGDFAEFFVNPVHRSGQTEGNKPRNRFIHTKDDIFVPADELTQQIATIYAHIQNLGLLDKKIGAWDTNSWPLQIGVLARVTDGRQLITNNAFYDGESDTINFVPQKGNNMQIYLNGGILAHEHFHSLFYKIVLKELNEKNNSQSHGLAQSENKAQKVPASVEEDLEKRNLNSDKDSKESPKDAESVWFQCILRGINEGLADFWAWVYSDDPDFLTLSLPEHKGNRSLKDDYDPSKGFLDENMLKNELQGHLLVHKDKSADDVAIAFSYRIGTTYARALKAITLTYEKESGVSHQDAREKVAQTIFLVLPQLAQDLVNLKTGANHSYRPIRLLETLVSGNSLGTNATVFVEQLSKNSLFPLVMEGR